MMLLTSTLFLLLPSYTAISSAIPPQHVAQPSTLQPRTIDVPATWEAAWCRGSKLSQAMIKDEPQAAAYITPARSPWDGDLAQEFRIWGYREIKDHRSELCDFGPDQHNLERAFAELGIATASSVDGGPNHCFYVEHKYGATVQRPPNGQWPDPNQQYYMVGERRFRVRTTAGSGSQHPLTIPRKPKHTARSASTPTPEPCTSSTAFPLPQPPGRTGHSRWSDETGFPRFPRAPTKPGGSGTAPTGGT